jgi:hypothetical protein
MATNFPASLDSLTNPSATDTLDSPPHDEQHADANDAIEALQAKVGVDSSAVTTSLDYKVANLESRPVETKTASYVLVAADVNKRIVMNSASATTITVNDAVFSAGDTVWIHNIGAGTTTVTAGTATVDTAGSLDVGQWEGGSLYFTSASSAIFFRGGAGPSLEVAYLVVAGGGGGGNSGNGGPGGGAGGYRTNTSIGNIAVATNYTVTVGAGGAGSTTTANSAGSSGVDSQFAGVTADGGGRGGAPHGGAGGSGGGGAYSNGNGGSGNSPARSGSSSVNCFGVAISDSQGFNGGSYATYGAGAGGGGLAAGGNGRPNYVGGIGGDGITSTISGSSVSYCGGGGGASGYGYGAGVGGLGGGGTGARTVAHGTAGTTNTGGGGGGGMTATYLAKSGGSGVVILRYDKAFTITLGAGLTGSTVVDGSSKVTTITAGSDNVSWN